MNPKLPSKPAFVAPTYQIDDLEEPMKHIVNALNKMAIYNPLCDSDTGTGKSSEDVPEAISKTASRVTGAEDALAELIRVTFIHTNMIKSLQATNAELSKQLKTVTRRLGQVERDFRELRDAQAIESQSMPRVLETATDERAFKHTPDGRLYDFAQHFWSNPFVVASTSEYDSSQWMDMSSIAATLALEPSIPSNASLASSRSSSSNCKERRSSKPHREEHVKRSRITYDGNGGQSPNISATAFTCATDAGAQEEMDFSNSSTTQSVRGSVCSDGERGKKAECSLTSWLYGKATKALFRQ